MKTVLALLGAVGVMSLLSVAFAQRAPTQAEINQAFTCRVRLYAVIQGIAPYIEDRQDRLSDPATPYRVRLQNELDRLNRLDSVKARMDTVLVECAP